MESKQFAMRMGIIEPICENTLRDLLIDGKKAGFLFDIRLNYYRGHFLSVIDTLRVFIDGCEMPVGSIQLKLNGKSFGIHEFARLSYEFWNVLQPATIVVIQPGGLADGEHEVELELMIRSPYMAIGPDHQYMPVDLGGKRTMLLQKTKEVRNG